MNKEHREKLKDLTVLNGLWPRSCIHGVLMAQMYSLAKNDSMWCYFGIHKDTDWYQQHPHKHVEWPQLGKEGCEEQIHFMQTVDQIIFHIHSQANNLTDSMKNVSTNQQYNLLVIINPVNARKANPITQEETWACSGKQALLASVFKNGFGCSRTPR